MQVVLRPPTTVNFRRMCCLVFCLETELMLSEADAVKESRHSLVSAWELAVTGICFQSLAGTKKKKKQGVFSASLAGSTTVETGDP